MIKISLQTHLRDEGMTVCGVDECVNYCRKGRLVQNVCPHEMSCCYGCCGCRQIIYAFYDDAPGPASVLLIYTHFMTYATRRIVLCSTKYSHIPTMFCTTYTLLFYPSHRHIHSDIEDMTA